MPESCRGAPYKAPLCKGGWTPPGGLGDCLSKTTGQRGFPADGERDPTQGKEVPRTTGGVSATGGDERTHTPCGERSAPPSLWGGIAATALLRRAASAASDAGSSCVGRPESIQSKGVPAAPRAVGNKENGPLERSKRERARGTIAAFLRKCSAAPHRGPRAICQRGQCRARQRELQEWSDQSPSHWGPRRAQRGGEWNHVPP